MFAFEWLVLVHAAALVLASAAAPRVVRRLTVVVGAAVLAALVPAVAWGGASALRLFLAPHVYLVSGYWLPALLLNEASRSGVPGGRFEAWLVRSDARLRPWLPGVPRRLVSTVELAYLLCYPLVPVSLGLVWWRGETADVGRFWLSVLAAGFACYGTLPWLVSRPPRATAGTGPEPRSVGALNAFVLGRFSHRWNTFPSGHVAVSVAAAWSVWEIWPAAGAAVGGLAAAVAVGAGAGRYHYVMDVFAGVVVALLAAMVTW
jgi:hypothetical protein